ncbi:hypothetical protein ON010_g9038 [Phytophthora cinnamomi]|nr:hypothetical protein ON010_g9038 [Phytophthora cinnamomi]
MSPRQAEILERNHGHAPIAALHLLTPDELPDAHGHVHGGSVVVRYGTALGSETGGAERKSARSPRRNKRRTSFTPSEKLTAARAVEECKDVRKIIREYYPDLAEFA